jgi:hypothetical protein
MPLHKPTSAVLNVVHLHDDAYIRLKARLFNAELPEPTAV